MQINFQILNQILFIKSQVDSKNTFGLLIYNMHNSLA
jgi:hypothetical protein